ncbi:hypothetical protein Pla22_26940 [Rubripirellula amarantea]|uniref:Uncharacterized protein n=1 Tax=Rubripirellula amarantea TaxID=2527999 RepID=A0A5C5WWW9_9BACT|nr:hypothetical protein [Rubripirellula amarantea]TWT55040.1 hypothetical protein Pla22_26940 [Rubripirellula amarantea]
MPFLNKSRAFFASFTLILVASFAANEVSAQGFNGGLGFLPYGFYQPYGAHYGTSLRTPPYFATNPPVYYGARHARPYGVSPFAAPPMVSAGPGYQSRLRSDFYIPRSAMGPVLPNPCIHVNPVLQGKLESNEETKLGAIQTNPFVESFDRVAKK